MIVLDSIPELRNAVRNSRANGEKIALVPTMGSLHKGHLKLIGEAREKGDIVVCTIFVNPIQFNDKSDFEKYPRNFEKDKRLLEQEKCDFLFAPSTEEIFRDGDSLKIDMGQPSKILEGKFRPGHFDGVALIVSKLFNIVQPDLAFFGQKDLQQLYLIKKLVLDLDFPIEIISVPTLRNKNGLALSSRNKRLSDSGIKEAEIISDSLMAAKAIYEDAANPEHAKDMALGLLKENGVDVEYFECVRLDTFEIINGQGYPGDVAFCVAGFVEEVRLIDNIIIKG